MQRTFLVFAFLVLLLAPALGQDPVKVAAEQCKVALENEYVRVLDWKIGPGQKTPMHDHRALVSIVLSGSKTRFTTSDGKTREVESRAGQATWSDPEAHSSENLGNQPAEVIQVEFMKRPGAEMTAIPPDEDPVKVDPKHYSVEFQNDRVRVLRVKYGPNEQSVMHAHPAGVAVFLTDGQTEFTLPDGKTRSVTDKAGQVQWTEKGAHLPKNMENKPFEVLLVELR